MMTYERMRSILDDEQASADDLRAVLAQAIDAMREVVAEWDADEDDIKPPASRDYDTAGQAMVRDFLALACYCKVRAGDSGYVTAGGDYVRTYADDVAD